MNRDVRQRWKHYSRSGLIWRQWRLEEQRRSTPPATTATSSPSSLCQCFSVYFVVVSSKASWCRQHFHIFDFGGFLRSVFDAWCLMCDARWMVELRTLPLCFLDQHAVYRSLCGVLVSNTPAEVLKPPFQFLKAVCRKRWLSGVDIKRPVHVTTRSWSLFDIRCLMRNVRRCNVWCFEAWCCSFDVWSSMGGWSCSFDVWCSMGSWSCTFDVWCSIRYPANEK